MKKETINRTILKYLQHLTNSDWIINEAYKFEFANFLQSNIDFQRQSDAEILDILLWSQKIKYDNIRGLQFIQKSGRETLKTFIQLNDISLIRQFQTNNFETIDWSSRSMSFTALSAWLSSLFPDKIFPIPFKGINTTVNYLFETDLGIFPKTGKKYIISCQGLMKQTQDELKNFPLEEIHLKVWNKYFSDNPSLNIKQKFHFDQVDWNWMTQDFHLFIHRKVLNLYKSKKANERPIEVYDNDEPTAKEGQSKLATHMLYERDSSFIRKIKMKAIQATPMLNCEICGFSFYEKYGELGQGFIEAHHKQPLSESKETITSKEDIVLVCSNCHRMLHKRMSQLDSNLIVTADELKAMIL